MVANCRCCCCFFMLLAGCWCDELVLRFSSCFAELESGWYEIIEEKPIAVGNPS